MDIQLGKPVVTSDGEKIGSVDSVVFDPKSRELVQFLVKHGGLLSEDRIISIQDVASVDSDGTVNLDIDSKLADQMPPFVEREYVQVEPHEYPNLPVAWAGGAGGNMMFWGTARPGLGYDPRSTFFEPAPIDPPTTEVRSNINEDSVLIKSGTDVVGSEGDKIGSVHDVLFDQDGTVRGLVVQAGFLFHHDVMIPGDLIDAVTSDHIRLSVPANEAESRGQRMTDSDTTTTSDAPYTTDTTTPMTGGIAATGAQAGGTVERPATREETVVERQTVETRETSGTFGQEQGTRQVDETMRRDVQDVDQEGEGDVEVFTAGDETERNRRPPTT